ncbi:MAG TPA: vanadium-dependent haloperoxidase, partial [Steroidobacteraceae bacterium]|nr:vanadium-dependent haloperoxidase [Steroidobacteraceae bacterium]
GIGVGEAAAAALIMLRTGDGSAPPEFHTPGAPAVGEWQATPGCPPAGGILLHWRNLQPVAIENTQQFRSPPPPPVRGLRYARDFLELKLVGGVDSPYRPQDRADVARFYVVAGAVPVWNAAATQTAIAQGRSLSENARALALLNAAISDALASVMETKYVYRFWRPETAIRAGDADGNPLTRADADFVPFVVAPCFPGYGSAHASAAGAAREVLERLYGRRHHFVALSHPAVPEVTLQYHSFREIAADIDDARVYGGIHFRFDQEAGARMGQQIGAYVIRHTLRRSFDWHD